MTIRASSAALFLTEDIILNYHYEIFPSYDPSLNIVRKPNTYELFDLFVERTANYTPYQLYCFKSKIDWFLQGMFEGANSSFLPIKHDDRIHLSLCVKIGNHYLPLTKNQKAIIEKAAEFFYDWKPDYALVFSGKLSYRDGPRTYPATWIRSILPHVVVPDRIDRFGSSAEGLDDTFLMTLKVYIATGNDYVTPSDIYISMSDRLDYTEKLTTVSLIISGQIAAAYDVGVILLDSVHDEKFIKDWMLIPYNLPHGLPGLYRPYWTNTLLCTDKVKFLTERYCCPSSAIMINGVSSMCNSYSEAEELLT